ncbi:hypothetical protein K435DRAFT_260649 [Dendrothele bispora CBS 962.96]|uniref:Uncharacterized protein n=1 Tax=Dendrothele bispora (strain CBS 962.96) TaxID=1314807 RepID=A0A4S8MXT4_DENBC|nr:hypothetical protein K435DRAFT_260649 [Dendrothele bispora CBS 962.96]
MQSANFPDEPDLGYLWTPFIILHMLGQAGILAILLTIFLSKQVHFHPTIINFWITWFIYSVSYSLQLYRNNREEVLGALISLPYLVFIAFGISSYIIGMRYLHYTGKANQLYCSLHIDEFSRYSIPAYCVAIITVVIIFEIAIIVKYIQTRRKASSAFPLDDRAFPVSLTIRVMIFSIASLSVLCITVFYLSNELPPWPYMMQASLPLAAVITFGFQESQTMHLFDMPGRNPLTLLTLVFRETHGH